MATMIPRPFYRSRLFWLGLPGLMFLSWGWWTSGGHLSSAEFGWDRPWWIAQSDGDFIVGWNAKGWPDQMKIHAGHNAMPTESARDWKKELEATRAAQANYRYVIVPYYAAVLAYVMGWLLAVAWWQRRKSRLLKLHTAP